MKEIIVICPNRPGAISDIAMVLADQDINIEFADAEGTELSGTVILQVDRYDDALQALADAEYQAYSDDSVVVRIEDKPGGLARLSLRIKEADINLQTLRIINRADGFCLAAIVADDQDAVRGLLEDVLITSA